jgi:regulator of protease activity HflC (stomatin/prohibitin superfamily)
VPAVRQRTEPAGWGPEARARVARDSQADPTRRNGPPPWALLLMRRRGIRRAGTLVLALIGLGLIVLVSGARFARENIGYVGVVRNGGPLDTRTIRQVLLPGQGLTWIGLFSQAPHQYPSASVNRTYTVTADPRRGNRSGVDVLTVPTRDGVQVGIEATVFMHFVGESNIRVLEQFDISYGTRKFTASNGRRLYPWQGDDGFYAWLDTLFRPVLEYDIRKEIGRFDCAKLVASCSLVTRGASVGTVPVVDSDNVARRISRSLGVDLERTIGHPYLRDLRVRIARVTLPTNVQTAIDDAQAKFAAVSGARADYRQARYEAKQKDLLGAAYNKSPALATIDALKAIPPGSTVIVSPGGKPPNIFAGVGSGASTNLASGDGGSTKPASGDGG